MYSLLRYKDSKGKQAKLKKPDQLQDLLDATRSLLEVRKGVLGPRARGISFC